MTIPRWFSRLALCLLLETCRVNSWMGLTGIKPGGILSRSMYTPGSLACMIQSQFRTHMSPMHTLSACKEASIGGEGDKTTSELMRDLLSCFQGEFDNYDQVVADHSCGLTPGPGGGHEHIHCSLHDVTLLTPSQITHSGGPGDKGGGGEGKGVGALDGNWRADSVPVVAAKYYFNGNPSIVFRYRLYSFHATEPGKGRGPIEMRLWRLLPYVEARLRSLNYNLDSFSWNLPTGGDSESNLSGDLSTEVVERMHGCDIYWSREVGEAGQPEAEGETTPAPSRGAGILSESKDQSGIVAAGTETLLRAGQAACDTEEVSGGGGQHKGATTLGNSIGRADLGPPAASGDFVGLMGEDDDGAWIMSQNTAGLEIRVLDDLRLRPGRLWINDRGFDREGKFVYGNQRGIPYEMKAVNAGGCLDWTLGKSHRTLELYAERMGRIGVTPGERLRFGAPVRTEPSSSLPSPS